MTREEQRIDDIQTMRILFNSDIEILCNQRRHKDAQEMEQIRDRLIEALKAQPCEDAVSKSNFDLRVRAAVGMVEEELTEDFKDGIKMVLELLKTEPPVTPARKKWIPIKDNPNEELPKDRLVWVTKDDCGYRYVDTVIWDMNDWTDSVYNVVGWMEYYEPEPYKEEMEERNEEE